jgi:hypothetical protein
MRPTKHTRALLCWVLIIALAWCLPAAADEVQLSDIIVTNTRDDLLIYMTIEGAFTEKMEAAILSGVPTAFTFYVELFRKRSFWLDKQIADLSVTHTVKYDTLNREFLVTRSWGNNEPLTIATLDEVKQLMSDLSGLKVLRLAELEKGRQYQLRAKAQMRKVTLPFHMHHILFFLSLWDFETDWYAIDFIY